MNVFINTRPVAVDAGASVLEGVRAFDPVLATAVEEGRAWLTDGVGRPLTPEAPLGLGDIVRVAISARVSRTDRDS